LLIIDRTGTRGEKECRSCDAGTKENVRHGRGLFHLLLLEKITGTEIYGRISKIVFERTRNLRSDDVSDEEWAFMAPYLTLCREDAPQREHALRAVFNGLRYIVRTGNQWRFMPGDLPPWAVVYQQTQRWMRAGVFEIMVEDVRSLLREFAGRKPQPTAMIVEPHAAVNAGVGHAGRIRWRQAAQGLKGACGGRYPGPSACLARNRGQRTGPRPGRAAGRRGPTDHRPHRTVNLCRSGIHRSGRTRRPSMASSCR
jgi:transposase